MKNEIVLGLLGVVIILGLAFLALGPMLSTPEGQLLMSIFK